MKVTPSFCFPFEIPDDPTTSITYVSFRKLNSDPSEVKNGVYQCPNCGHEDHSLAQWRRLQSSQEKWDEGLMRWYQKKKCERKCVAEVFLTSLTDRLRGKEA